MEAVLEAGDHPEVAPAAANRPEQVRVLALAGTNHPPVGEHLKSGLPRGALLQPVDEGVRRAVSEDAAHQVADRIRGQRIEADSGEQAVLLGAVAEAAGDDHGAAEEVVPVGKRLAGVEAGADPQRRAVAPAFDASMVRCIATAQPTAATGLVNATVRPSPRLLTSRPPASETARRSREKCSRFTASALSSPSRSSIWVEPTRSVNRKVTTPVVSVTDAPHARPQCQEWYCGPGATAPVRIRRGRRLRCAPGRRPRTPVCSRRGRR